MVELGPLHIQHEYNQDLVPKKFTVIHNIQRNMNANAPKGFRRRRKRINVVQHIKTTWWHNKCIQVWLLKKAMTTAQAKKNKYRYMNKSVSEHTWYNTRNSAMSAFVCALLCLVCMWAFELVDEYFFSSSLPPVSCLRQFPCRRCRRCDATEIYIHFTQQMHDLKLSSQTATAQTQQRTK